MVENNSDIGSANSSGSRKIGASSLGYRAGAKPKESIPRDADQRLKLRRAAMCVDVMQMIGIRLPKIQHAALVCLVGPNGSSRAKL